MSSLRSAVSAVAIFANEMGKMEKSPPKVKSKQFRPRLENGTLELSTFCLEQLTELESWSLLDKQSNKPVVGRAELSVIDVEQIGLVCDPDWDPERHVNIVSWPTEEKDVRTAAQTLYDVQRCIPRENAARSA